MGSGGRPEELLRTYPARQCGVHEPYWCMRALTEALRIEVHKLRRLFDAGFLGAGVMLFGKKDVK